MNRRLVMATLLSLAQAGLVLAAAPPADVQMAWMDGNSVELRLEEGTTKDFSEYSYRFMKDDDMEVRINHQQAGKKISGQTMLVANTLLIRGLDLNKGDELDALDVPVLEFQILARILAYGTRKKPAEIKQRLSVRHVEDKDTLAVATVSASGAFRPVWLVEGSVEPKPDGKIGFDLVFSRNDATGSTERTRYAGTWSRVEPMQQIPDKTPLTGWKAFGLAMRTKKEGEVQGGAYGASPIERSFQDAGELRAWVKQKKQQEAPPKKQAAPAPAPAKKK